MNRPESDTPCLKTWLISRHGAAREWVELKGVPVDRILTHLEQKDYLSMVPGDCVIGNLPLAWIARLNAHGVRYINLDLTIPAHLRGQELDLAAFQACQPALTEYRVEQIKRWS